MAIVFLVLLGLFAISAGNDSKSDLTIATTSGILQGKRETTLNKPLRLFLGVPYAQPPVGSLRFKPPVPILSEDIKIDASRFAPSCIQPHHIESVISSLLTPNRAEINEDCLFLNVYVPDNIDPNTPLPVMVWLAGEGFDYADPQQFDGSYLAVEGNVIVVTVNYRLSVFGFLSSLSEDAPGNVGLLDQRLALKWVKENIQHFGGNAENVTLFGRFTGSMSAVIHAFSPLNRAEQLFKRVILQSGVPVGDWAFDKNPLNVTFALAEAMNCLYSQLSDVVDCLRRQPAEVLLNAALNLPRRFRPIFDFHLIFETPLRAAMNAEYSPVDMMVGFNNDEGSLCVNALKAMQSSLYQKILHHTLSKSDFDELVKGNMFEFYKEHDPLADDLAVYNYKKSEGQLRKDFVDFCGDIYITARSQRLANLVAKKNSNVYMYELEHRPSFSINPTFIRAGHGDDVLYAFGLPLQMADLPKDEARLTRRMVEAVSNFARSGNPNPQDAHTQWPRYTTEKRELMSFTTFRDNEKSPIKASSHDAAVTFWHEIIPATLQRTCPLPPMTSALVAPEAFTDSDGEETYFLGTLITLPTAEYIMMGLLGASGFLFLLFIITVGLLYKAKRATLFHRLS